MVVARSLMRSMIDGSLEEGQQDDPMEEGEGPHQTAPRSPQVQEVSPAAARAAKYAPYEPPWSS